MAVTALRPDGELYRTWRPAERDRRSGRSEPTLEHVKGLLQDDARSAAGCGTRC